MSSRRSTGMRGDSRRRQALEDLRKMREGGGLRRDDAHSGGDSDDGQAPPSKIRSRVAEYKVQEESIFETVTDQQYEDIVRKRRQEMPFVENDTGELGYYDDGEEQFFESEPEADPNDVDGGDDDGDDGKGKKRGAGALSSAYVRRAKKMQRAKLGSKGDQKITNMFFSSSKATSSASSSHAAAAAGGARKARANVKRGMCCRVALVCLSHLTGFCVSSFIFHLDIDLDSMLDDLTSNPTESCALPRGGKQPETTRCLPSSSSICRSS